MNSAFLLQLFLPTLALGRDISSMFAGRPRSIPAIGSAAWTALYPPPSVIPPPRQLWLDALEEAITLDLIPNDSEVPVAANSGGWPSYGGLDGASEAICHNALGCHTDDDGWDGPDGYFGVSQDDGPLPFGPTLYRFFNENHIPATHFYIGSNILNNWEVFLEASKIPEQHFAVHTWTHPYMTALSNEEVLGEIGWTMQIIADNHGGRIPAFWRPPYGDVDNRVRAIAKHVFGLKTIIWNHDSEDWTIGSGANPDTIEASLQGWVDGPKSPGLIPLEHELSEEAVQVFINVYPSMISNGWKLRNIAQIFKLPWYANADDWKSPLRPSGSGPSIASMTANNLTTPSNSPLDPTIPSQPPATQSPLIDPSNASNPLTSLPPPSLPQSPPSQSIPRQRQHQQSSFPPSSSSPPLTSNNVASPPPPSIAAALADAATSAHYRPPQSHQQQGLNRVDKRGEVSRSTGGGCHRYHGVGAGQGEGRTGSFKKERALVDQTGRKRMAADAEGREQQEAEKRRREVPKNAKASEGVDEEEKRSQPDREHPELQLFLWPH